MNQLIIMIQLYDKVKVLIDEKLTVSQISRIIGVDRKTVRKYRDMSQEQINVLVDREVRRKLCKLEPYREFVSTLLKAKPMLSSPQVHDRLLERYPDFPDVASRTMYSFVQRIRKEYDIPFEKEPTRQFARVDQFPYGKQAQVDFGEMFLENMHGGRTKVYFMLMVLRRSCYKFVYFQSYPFTSETAMYAHHLAFRYFGGVPEEVVYDQDTTFIVDENYGQYHMTSVMEKYVLEVGYKPVFMMARDPQSKGLVEVYVKYIKRNFLRGRTYVNDESLNDEAMGWLQRTGNQNMHSIYRFVPSAEFAIERGSLKAYNTHIDGPDMSAKSYVVKKDNTISYRGNVYSVPLGTYKRNGTRVLVVINEADQQIEIYGEEDCRLIGCHDLVTHRKGVIVTDPEHRKREPAKTLLKAEAELRDILTKYGSQQSTDMYLRHVYDAGPRYYRKAIIGILHVLKKIESVVELENIIQSIQEQCITNPNDVQEYVSLWENVPCDITLPCGFKAEDITPAKRDLSDFESAINDDRPLKSYIYEDKFGK